MPTVAPVLQPLCPSLKARSGDKCNLPAGWGTDHVGTGCCKWHGGNSPTHRKKAKTELAESSMVLFAESFEIDPHLALLQEVYRTAGHIEWLTQLLKEYTTKEDLMELTPLGVQPNIWFQLYHKERKHLLDAADKCIRAGVAERTVQIAEQQGAMLARVIQAVLDDLKLNKDQKARAPQLIREHLMALPMHVENEAE